MPGGRHFWPDRWSKEEKKEEKKERKKRKPKKCLSGNTNNLKIAKIELVIYYRYYIFYNLVTLNPRALLIVVILVSLGLQARGPGMFFGTEGNSP